MSTAFSLWCHRMVLEYVGQAPAGSSQLDEVRRRLLNVEWLGSTALAPAMAHYVSGAPLPLTWRREGGRIVLNGRVPWASNLFRPDFFQVAAAAHTETGEVIVAGIPGEVAGPCVDAYPDLLALQSTASASLTYRDVRLDPAWIITHDFRPFIREIRPSFLLLQSSFCWGLAQRALAEARTALKGVNESLRGDLDALAAESDTAHGVLQPQPGHPRRGHAGARAGAAAAGLRPPGDGDHRPGGEGGGRSGLRHDQPDGAPAAGSRLPADSSADRRTAPVGTRALRVAGARTTSHHGHTEAVVFHAVDLAVETGEICVLLGSSGCGKSKNIPAEQGPGSDCLQRPLRSRFWQQLRPGVAMIDIANGCAKRTYKSDLWRNRCVNHHYFLMCTQGKS